MWGTVTLVQPTMQHAWGVWQASAGVAGVTGSAARAERVRPRVSNLHDLGHAWRSSRQVVKCRYISMAAESDSLEESCGGCWTEA
jgi:hypothetical protein